MGGGAGRPAVPPSGAYQLAVPLPDVPTAAFMIAFYTSLAHDRPALRRALCNRTLIRIM
jgi:hypothetical protein